MDYRTNGSNSAVLNTPGQEWYGIQPERLNGVVERMLGGSVDSFFAEHWGRKPLYVQGAAADYAGCYRVEDYLADLEATQPAPYLSVGVRDGRRYFQKHATPQELLNGVREGRVSAMKLSKFWHQMPTPDRIAWARALFGGLCRAVSMIYLGPGRSEDVDLFLAGPDSQLGTHFDTTEVFTLQLFGERKWTVDKECCLEKVLNLYKSSDWQPAQEIGFQSDTMEVTLRPGDALYVPAYAVHRVTGVSWSVSLSLGLRAFNEIDIVDRMLEILRLTRYAEYPPASSVPESQGETHVGTKLELIRKVRALLQQIEQTATGYVLQPLSLPSSLQNFQPAEGANNAKVLGAFTSGFALFEESKNSRQ